MKKITTYRLASFFLALVFCVFNVGLPIVVASCPMTKMKGSSCCCEKSDSTGVALNGFKNTDCCKTTIAAERNKTEFLQGQSAVASIQYSITPSLQFALAPQFYTSLLITSYSLSPPPSKDIPIFISSLLI